MTKIEIETIMALADSYATYASTAGIERYLGQNRMFDLVDDARNALRTALEAALNPMEHVALQRYEAELWREDRIRFEPDTEGDWVKFSDVCNLYTESPEWLPISSAPKDGTMFDGWNGERVVDVTWAHPSYSATGHHTWCVSGYANGHDWEHDRVNGLTHWLPIPTAPKDTP